MIWLSIYLICAAVAAIKYMYCTVKDDKDFLKNYHIVGILVVIVMGLAFPAAEIYVRLQARRIIKGRKNEKLEH